MSLDVGPLDEALSISPRDGREMVLLIRRIIRDWVNAELPYPIEELDVLVGIESQSDHLLGGKVRRVFGSAPPEVTRHEEDELADLYGFFQHRYEAARIRLITCLGRERAGSGAIPGHDT
jgi:hypothetical protein